VTKKTEINNEINTGYNKDIVNNTSRVSIKYYTWTIKITSLRHRLYHKAINKIFHVRISFIVNQKYLKFAPNLKCAIFIGVSSLQNNGEDKIIFSSAIIIRMYMELSYK
jgi:hypothetical protein